MEVPGVKFKVPEAATFTFPPISKGRPAVAVPTRNVPVEDIFKLPNACSNTLVLVYCNVPSMIRF